MTLGTQLWIAQFQANGISTTTLARITQHSGLSSARCWSIAGPMSAIVCQPITPGAVCVTLVLPWQLSECSAVCSRLTAWGGGGGSDEVRGLHDPADYVIQIYIIRLSDAASQV